MCGEPLKQTCRLDGIQTVAHFAQIQYIRPGKKFFFWLLQELFFTLVFIFFFFLNMSRCHIHLHNDSL